MLTPAVELLSGQQDKTGGCTGQLLDANMYDYVSV